MAASGCGLRAGRRLVWFEAAASRKRHQGRERTREGGGRATLLPYQRSAVRGRYFEEKKGTEKCTTQMDSRKMTSSGQEHPQGKGAAYQKALTQRGELWRKPRLLCLSAFGGTSSLSKHLHEERYREIQTRHGRALGMILQRNCPMLLRNRKRDGHYQRWTFAKKPTFDFI